MSEVSTLTIVSRDKRNFESLIVRARALLLKAAHVTHRYADQAAGTPSRLIQGVQWNPDTLSLSVDFDAMWLEKLDVAHDGLAAFTAAEEAIKLQRMQDKRIEQLHVKASKHWPELEKIIDELKGCGQHSLNGNNALDNVRQWLRDLSKR